MSNYTPGSEPKTPNNLFDCSSSDATSAQNSGTSKVRVDCNLNLRNAEGKGYQWEKDTVFTHNAPFIFQDIIRLVNKGYRLGQPNLTTTSKVLVGLYKPKG